ncbi:nucleotidyl transferase AbiEii/AbiGii toxin family protein [Thauera sp. SDU_THAU2]|uniref:nucleotidyl transferase AbiEii/AbiGii toxin family protein n=1 Tax=Thauera sp. SDU_THAU2 TaxID=3136633 RepID=UPI00311DD4B7
MSYDPDDIRAAQEHFGFLDPAPVEKDWHVLRALRTIAAVDAAPFQLVFAGGTCLARGHRLVSRMSEDVDFKVVLLDSGPLSRSRRRGLLGELRNHVLAALQAEGFGIEAQDMRSRDENQYILYNLRYTHGGIAASPLRPTIQVELTYAQLRLPPVLLPVSSFVAEAFGREPELTAMPCVSITETAAEKLVSLTRRTAMELRGLSRQIDPNLVRHIYDLYAIHQHIDRAATVEIARATALSDAREFINQFPAYVENIAGETRHACIALQSDPVVRERYTRFVSAMVYGHGVDFDAAMRVIVSLVDEAWPAA